MSRPQHEAGDGVAVDDPRPDVGREELRGDRRVDAVIDDQLVHEEGLWSRGEGFSSVRTPTTGPRIAATQSQDMPHGSRTSWPAATMIAREISG